MKRLICLLIACTFTAWPSAATPPSSDESTSQLTIELKDGSVILGNGLSDSLSFHSTAMGDFKMTWADISTLEYPQTGAGLAKLVAANGDVYEVQSESPTVMVITKFGQRDLPMKLIRSVKVLTMATSIPAPQPENIPQGKLQLTIGLADGSTVIGQLPTQPLAFHTTTLGDIKIPWSTIATISIGADAMHLTAANGDQITGQLSFDTLHVDTSFGKIDLPVKTIRTIVVTREGTDTAHLIGWWKLDDGSGTVARDSNPGPNKHDGNLVNNPQWVQVSGPSGMCLQFGGSGQYVALGNVLQDGYPEISIACWEKSYQAADLQVIGERNTWDQPDGIALCVGGRNQAHFGHWLFSTGNSTVNSSDIPRDNQWHHLVGTMTKTNSGYTYKTYVDGRLDGTATTTAGLNQTTTGWLIGAQPVGPSGQWEFHGLLKDFRIYGCALSATQVETIYAEQPSLASHPISQPPSPPFNPSSGG